MRKPRQPSSRSCLHTAWLVPHTLVFACMGCNSISRYGMEANPKGAMEHKAWTEVRAALHCAAKRGNLALVQSLLDAGANPNARDVNGRRPIHLAVQGRHLSVVEALLKAGANPNATGPNTTTRGHLTVVEALRTGSQTKGHQTHTERTPEERARAPDNRPVA